MSSGDFIEIIEFAISTLENIQQDFEKMFDLEGDNKSLFIIRQEYLQLFNSLAISFHHSNTIKFLNNGELGTTIFKNEVDNLICFS